jgi:hypothetical protein
MQKIVDGCAQADKQLFDVLPRRFVSAVVGRTVTQLFDLRKRFLRLALERPMGLLRQDQTKCEVTSRRWLVNFAR